ncbi:Uncharacterised protein [Clostridioides difficile]|nr:Uncharacterised protein [Clostridioides difficile]VHX79765.1 Uncharacterised protein [Clostridioides difficile]
MLYEGSIPGPSGILNIINNINSIVHTIKNDIEYGIILAITVPIPASLSYFLVNASIIGKYGNNGLSGFVIHLYDKPSE